MKRFIEIISKVALLSRVVWPKNTSSPTSVTSSTNRRKKNIVSLVFKNLNILFWSSEVAVFNSKQIRQGCYCSRKLSPMEFNGVSKKVFWTFSYLNLAADLKNHQKKSPKNDSLNRDLLKILNRYGIFWVPPGESSCPDGSEYVWERGVGSLQGQVTAARSLPLFREEKKCPKNDSLNRHLLNFFNKYGI